MTALRVAISGLFLANLAACGDDRFPDYRYKITIHARGNAYSSVRAVHQTETTSIQDSSGRKVERSLEGQAVILNLPDGRTIYALLSGRRAPDQAQSIANVALLPSDEGPPKSGDMLSRIAAEQQAMVKIVGPRDLPRTVYHNPSHRVDQLPTGVWPLFAEFANREDWSTLHSVPPDSIGVDRITIEITDEPVTTGIEKQLTPPGKNPEFRHWVTTLKPDDERLDMFSAFYSRRK